MRLDVRKPRDIITSPRHFPVPPISRKAELLSYSLIIMLEKVLDALGQFRTVERDCQCVALGLDAI